VGHKSPCTAQLLRMPRKQRLRRPHRR
jgi:hypothetical protein